MDKTSKPSCKFSAQKPTQEQIDIVYDALLLLEYANETESAEEKKAYCAMREWMNSSCLYNDDREVVSFSHSVPLCPNCEKTPCMCVSDGENFNQSECTSGPIRAARCDKEGCGNYATHMDVSFFCDKHGMNSGEEPVPMDEMLVLCSYPECQKPSSHWEHDMGANDNGLAPYCDAAEEGNDGV